MAQPSSILHPLDIITFFISSEGRTTNMQLVKNFRSFLQESENVSEEVVEINKSLLKIVTGHIANVRKQGTREINRNDTMEGGKLIIVKNKFKGKTADEIWSTLILSLPIDEINRMTPREEGIVAKEDVKVNVDTNPPVSITHPAVVLTKPPSGRQVGKPTAKSVTIVDGPEEDDVFSDTTNVIRNTEADGVVNIPSVDGSQKDCSTTETSSDKKENNLLESEVTDIDKRKSVRDLKKAYDQYANESTVSLADHVAKEAMPKPQVRRPKSINNFDKWKPLTKEGHAWILSATRGDYQTLARLAKSDGQLVNCRDPATGYTALHWAAKNGHADIVKLLAGSYGQDPDVKTRGGYTPIMLAGMCKREEVFDLLTKAYHANDDIRDFSGVTARQYLHQHHLNIPGSPPPVDLSHDPLLRGKSLRQNDTSRKSRTKVARSATTYFMKELRDSVREVRGSIRANIKNRPKSVGE